MDKILDGAKPADLPVQRLAINLKRAKALGITRASPYLAVDRKRGNVARRGSFPSAFDPEQTSPMGSYCDATSIQAASMQTASTRPHSRSDVTGFCRISWPGSVRTRGRG